MGGGLKAYKSVVGGRLGAVKSSVKTFMASQMGETMDGLRRRSRAHGELASEQSAEQGGKKGVLTGRSWYKLVIIGIKWYRLVKAGTSWYKLVQVGTRWHIMYK